jgi:signal transduction histidine kinase
MNSLSQVRYSETAAESPTPDFGAVGSPMKQGDHHKLSPWLHGIHFESLANLAHELRTPVQVLFGYLDILRDDHAIDAATDLSHAPRQNIIERMSANVHELSQTVENVLEFALTLARAETAIEEEVDVAGFFAEVEEVMGSSKRNLALALRFHLEAAPRTVITRRRQLRSIVLNLVSNALKFTADGEVTITVTKADGAPNLCIEVRDTGAGIGSDALSSAFEPLVQLSSSSIRRHRGLGLGLSLVQLNVTSLRGRLQVESKPGVGSCFKVTIPCSGSGPHMSTSSHN